MTSSRNDHRVLYIIHTGMNVNEVDNHRERIQQMLEQYRFQVLLITGSSREEFMNAISNVLAKAGPIEAIVVSEFDQQNELCNVMIRSIRSMSKQFFICVFSPLASDVAQLRYEYFQSGASMVTPSISHMSSAFESIYQTTLIRGRYQCPFCGKDGFREDQLWIHCPLYHINEVNAQRTCPICKHSTKRPFQVRAYPPYL